VADNAKLVEFLSLIAYYDVLDKPVSDLLCKDVDIKRVQDLIDRNILSYQDGFYFLSGRDFLVALQKKRSEETRKKLHFLRRIIKHLAWIPSIEAIFASGSLAMQTSTELSDLDVLVITKHRRIWTTRFLLTMVTSILGVRRTRNESRAPNKLCFNHYITDQSLSIPFVSLYNAYTYANLVPLFSKGEIVSDFFDANTWIPDFVPNVTNNHDERYLYTSGWLSRTIASLCRYISDTSIGNGLETFFKMYQWRRIEKSDGTLEEGVMISDECLSFHPDSPEQELQDKYTKRFSELCEFAGRVSITSEDM
jgi:predicted nucleotidyltransferase